MPCECSTWPSFEGPYDTNIFHHTMCEKGTIKMSTLRCKMRVSEVAAIKDGDGSTFQERVKLQAVYGPDGTDNAQWSKWTPSANFEITINNPEAFNKLSSGHEFYVDFTPAEKAESA
jgi:hypothetical protein